MVSAQDDCSPSSNSLAYPNETAIPARLPATEGFQAFQEEDPSDLPGGKSHGSQRADFLDPLFHAQPEEKRRQQDGRDDQEEAEVNKIFAEVGRAGRCFQTLGFHRAQDQA